MTFKEYLENKGISTQYNRLLEALKVDGIQFYSQYTKDRSTKTKSEMFNQSMNDNLNKILLESFPEIATLVACNHLSKTFKDKALQSFNSHSGRYMMNVEFLELLQRFSELMLTLDQLADTKLCFIDTETTGLGSSRLPIQIAYMVTDIEMNYIDHDRFYIQQDYVEPGASDVNGLTVERLQELNALQPQGGLERFTKIIEGYKPVFVAHNASFDRDTIINLYNQVGRQCPYDKLKFYCTFLNASAFSNEKGKGARKLGRLAEVNNIYDTDIQKFFKTIEPNIEENLSAHDAFYDIVMLYLMCKKVKLFGTK